MIPSVYPFVTRLISPDKCANKPFPTGQAEGVTVHYTADREIERCLRSLHSKALTYHIMIDRDGSLIQSCYLDKSCFHAGKAMWRNKKPNETHLSIAIVSWGYLEQHDEKFYSWNKSEVPVDSVAIRKGNIMIPGNNEMPWDKATAKQEQVLFDVLQWCVSQGIDPRDICGHDECALPIGRKSDPGGVLSFSMQDLRNRLNVAGIV